MIGRYWPRDEIVEIGHLQLSHIYFAVIFVQYMRAKIYI